MSGVVSERRCPFGSREQLNSTDSKRAGVTVTKEAGRRRRRTPNDSRCSWMCKMPPQSVNTEVEEGPQDLSVNSAVAAYSEYLPEFRF